MEKIYYTTVTKILQYKDYPFYFAYKCCCSNTCISSEICRMLGALAPVTCHQLCSMYARNVHKQQGIGMWSHGKKRTRAANLKASLVPQKSRGGWHQKVHMDIMQCTQS